MAKNPRIDRDSREPLRRSEVATDYGISLARIQWDFFATLTFAGNVPRTQIAYGLAFRWLQELAKVCGVPYKRLLIALRGEEGEKNGRFHFHCLVGGTTTRNYHTLQHQAEHLWKIQSGGAHVDVRQYDRSLAGADCRHHLRTLYFRQHVSHPLILVYLVAGVTSYGQKMEFSRAALCPR